MAKNIARLTDPYDIPAHLIPPGMVYQWVAKKNAGHKGFGRIDPQYQAMTEAGWVEVPYKRLEEFYRGRYRGEETEKGEGPEKKEYTGTNLRVAKCEMYLADKRINHGQCLRARRAPHVR